MLRSFCFSLIPCFVFCVGSKVGAQELPMVVKSLFVESMHYNQNKQHDKAFDTLQKLYINYRDYLDQNKINDLTGLMVGEVFSGIGDYQEGREDSTIPDEWLERIEKIPPVTKDSDTGSRFMQYSVVLYQATWKYLTQDDYASSKLNFLKADAYYQKTSYFKHPETLPGEHRETKDWIEKVRKVLRTRIEKERIDIGTYVTNTGFTQKWIGRVVKNDGAKDVMAVRMTFSNSPTFSKGVEYNILKEELQVLKGVSLRAIIKGYK